MPGEFRYDWERPALTADVLALTVDAGTLNVLLIERAQDPYAGCRALPGGFVEPTETPAAGARRELLEETGLSAGRLWPLPTFGKPGRDPRGWTITAPFYTLVPVERSAVAGTDDASSAAWYPVRRPGKLAFDHAEMLKAGLAAMRRDLWHLPIAADLLPSTITSAQLHAVYRTLDPSLSATAAALAKRLLAANVLRESGSGLKFTRMTPPEW
jgi:8-oxo-dGTP diphosphatase